MPAVQIAQNIIRNVDKLHVSGLLLKLLHHRDSSLTPAVVPIFLSDVFPIQNDSSNIMSQLLGEHDFLFMIAKAMVIAATIVSYCEGDSGARLVAAKRI